MAIDYKNQEADWLSVSKMLGMKKGIIPMESVQAQINCFTTEMSQITQSEENKRKSPQ